MTRRMTACFNKVVYTNKADAQRQVRPGMKVYRCLNGEHWHVAHQKGPRPWSK